MGRRKAAMAVAAVVATAGLATGAATTGAFAATSPQFLKKAELPQGDRYGTWLGSGIKSGLPTPAFTCVKGTLPKTRTSYRTFSSEFDAEARETVTVAKDVASAKLIAKEVAQSIERCADKLGDNTTWKRYASYDVEEGLTVYGVFFAPEGSEYHLQLFGVGRDGKAVVVVALGQMGKKSEAPVGKFTKTAKTALTKAF